LTPLKKVNREKRTGICGGAGYARTPTYTPPYSSRLGFFSALIIIPQEEMKNPRKKHKRLFTFWGLAVCVCMARVMVVLFSSYFDLESLAI